jgi:hypothetical protein
MVEPILLELTTGPAASLPAPGTLLWVSVSEALEVEAGRGGDPVPGEAGGEAALFRVRRGAELAASGEVPLFASRLDLDLEVHSVLRVDHIRLGAGMVTPRHRHAGPGIRFLVAGGLDAMVGARRYPVRAGEAWLETVEDDVIGRAGPAGAAFLRFVLLPAALAGGQSSFIGVPSLPGDPDPSGFAREQTILAEIPVA